MPADGLTKILSQQKHGEFVKQQKNDAELIKEISKLEHHNKQRKHN